MDVGLDINTTANYNVALEATLGTKAIVSSSVLEGVIIQGVDASWKRTTPRPGLTERH